MRHDQFHVHLLENDNHPSVTKHYSSCDFNNGLVGTPIGLLVEFLYFILQTEGLYLSTLPAVSFR